MNAALLVFFFLSGLSSLIYQVVWLKYLTLTFGATTPSVTAILMAFMGGLSLGSFLFGRISGRVVRPVVWYAAMEAGIGLYALAVPFLFGQGSRLFVLFYRVTGGESLLTTAFRFFLAILLFLLPTVLMGGTLPLLARYAEQTGNLIGRRTGGFYGVNTLGAFAGVLLSTFWAVPALGFGVTTRLAAVINGAVALGGFLLGRRMRMPAGPAKGSFTFPRFYAALFFLMGFTSLGYEVYWSRVLAIHIGSNVYAYGLMLSVILLGIGLGSLIFAAFFKSTEKPSAWLGGLELLLALAILLQVLMFSVFPSILTRLGGWPWPTVQWQVFGSLFLGVFTVLFLPTLLMGISFPLCVHMIVEDRARAGEGAGRVYAWNTLGAIAGTFTAGMIAVPLLGTLKGLLLYAAINASLGAALWSGKRRVPALAAVAALLVSAAVLDPRSLFLNAGQYQDAKTQILDFQEDTTGAVVVIRRPEGLSLEINGVNVAGTSPDNALIQKLQGHLPFGYNPGARRVLHIGLGSGSTAHAVSLHPVERIRVAEISPGIVKQARRNFLEYNGGILSDPRVGISIVDGRNYVLAAPEKFDLILSDSIHPKYLGNGFLYTKEYFELVRARLATGGACSMWLPMYSLTTKNFREILKAFSDVFPATTVWWFPEPPNAFTVVMGSGRPLTLQALRACCAEPAVARDLAAAGLKSWEAVAAGCVLGPGGVARMTAGVAAHSDDRPTAEYESNLIFTKTSTWGLNLRELFTFWEPPADIFGPDSVSPGLEAAGDRYKEEMRRQILALLARPGGQ